MKSVNVLITEQKIPSEGYTSWEQFIEYYLMEFPGNLFDYLITQHSNQPFVSQRTKRFNCVQNRNRVLNRLLTYKYRYAKYLAALDTIFAENDHATLWIVDSVRIKGLLWDYISAKGWQKRARLVFYQHGFTYGHSNPEFLHFSKGLHSLVLLSHVSYRHYFMQYMLIPYHISVLYNPIRHNLFNVPTQQEKLELRRSNNMDEEATQFIWVSHDRPNKGLSIVLKAWEQFVAKLDAGTKVCLNIVGANRDVTIPHVKFWGRVLNKELPNFLKAADIFVFSSVTKEGFPLSLAEAMSCGCYCITSFVGGIQDFFKDPEHGIAIHEPNYIESWEKAFEKALTAYGPWYNNQNNEPPKRLFMTYEEWAVKFSELISLNSFSDNGK